MKYLTKKYQIRKSLSSFLSLKEYKELKTWLYSDQAKLSENWVRLEEVMYSSPLRIFLYIHLTKLLENLGTTEDKILDKKMWK